MEMLLEENKSIVVVFTLHHACTGCFCFVFSIKCQKLIKKKCQSQFPRARYTFFQMFLWNQHSKILTYSIYSHIKLRNEHNSEFQRA